MKNRESVIALIENKLEEAGYEVLRVPLTDSSTSMNFRLAIPTLDDNNVEATIVVNAAVMKQKRDGTTYDPYEQNERYLENVAIKEEKKRIAEENKNKRNKKKGSE